MKNVWYYEFPIGKAGIAEEGGAITHVFFEGQKAPADCRTNETPALQNAAAQLGDYFEGRRTEFDLPLLLKGTPFQMSVWKALQAIPPGETRSYKEIAMEIGNPKATRAVGLANNRNPIPIIVPCHRVVGANGSLTGYGGGLHIKQFLLDLEKRV